MLSNVKENTLKSRFKAIPACHLNYSLYGLPLLVFLPFFSVLPFGSNKKASQRLSSALCWCIVHKAREVVNLSLKRNFYFLSDAFSKLFLTTIMLKCQCLIHFSTMQAEKKIVSDCLITKYSAYSQNWTAQFPLNPCTFWAFTSQVPLPSWNSKETQVVFRESYHYPSYIPMNVRFSECCQGGTMLGWG